MKSSRILAWCFLIFLSCTHKLTNAQSIVGTLKNSTPVITVDKATLIKNYTRNLLELSNINGEFTEVSILSLDGNYYLVFKGAKYKSSMLLSIQNDATGSSSNLVSGKVSCTTDDCASEPRGCVPAMEGLACLPCANKGKCTKTVTSGGSLIE